MTTIDNNNYELWLLRYAEGDLSAEEHEAVEVWLAGHPEAAEELALYDEAPRLGADVSVRYEFPLPQHTQPLRPAALRWSAAAAVVAALMVPALRMGTMDTLETPAPLLAEAVDTKHPNVSKDSKVLKDSMDLKDSKIPKNLNFFENKIKKPQEESIAALTDSLEPEIEQTIIEVNTLIVYETEQVKEDTFYTTGLIAYDRSADWGDVLLAANDAYRESLNERPLGRMVSRVLPDSRQLEENVVEPLREKIDNIKSIIK